ncbi:MAG: M20/M25/M40 family metallo-hydrolase [Treponema sp.]|jgi:acetylornithine deacetylase/succinyl-diaminopimelate desuccinylase-like protein|nr:M20/M25/M40 family metallo-hydrolase [Treponema sp.]
MKKIFQYIDDHRDEYLSLLKEFCAQPSISTTHTGIEEMVRMVSETMRSVNVEPEIIPTAGNPMLYGELKGTGKRVLGFYNHYDVQPPEPLDEWKSDPFKPEIRDGKMYARGVSDNKGSLLARICAVDAWQKVYGQLPLNLRFVYEGEEEVGSPHLAWFAETYPEKIKTDGFIWEGGERYIDGPLQISLGVKGMCYLELRVRTAAMDAHSKHAAIIPNPAWRLVHALSTMKDRNDKILIENFYDKMDKVTGQDREYLRNLYYNEESIKNRMQIGSFINNLTGIDLLEKLLYEPTCNIAGIHSGYTGQGSKTVLPCTASVKMDIRLIPQQDPEEIAELVRKHLRKHGFEDIEVVQLSGMHPFRTNPDNPLAQTAFACAEEVYGIKPAIYRNAPGTTAMYRFCHKQNLPVLMFGVSNEASQNHAPNENIYVEDYFQGIKMITAVLKKFAGF